MKTSCLYNRAILLAILSLFYVCCSFAAEEEQDITAAVIAVDDAEVAKKIVDLAYPVFQESERIVLLERSKIELVQRELELSEALASPARRLRLGETLGADFLILAEVLEYEEDETDVSLRVVDSATGCVVAGVSLPTDNVELTELLDKSATHFCEKMRWLVSAACSELIPISIPTLTSLSPGSLADEKIRERLRHHLFMRLGNQPGLIALERDELERARRICGSVL